MIQLVAKDIMFSRVSMYAKYKEGELVNKFMINYAALPVINDDVEVIRIISDHDALNALDTKWMFHEFSAETLMICGNAERGVCTEPLPISADILINDIANTRYKRRVSVLSTGDGRKKHNGSFT
jgi:hypothetical protein